MARLTTTIAGTTKTGQTNLQTPSGDTFGRVLALAGLAEMVAGNTEIKQRTNLVVKGRMPQRGVVRAGRVKTVTGTSLMSRAMIQRTRAIEWQRALALVQLVTKVDGNIELNRRTVLGTRKAVVQIMRMLPGNAEMSLKSEQRRNIRMPQKLPALARPKKVVAGSK